VALALQPVDSGMDFPVFAVSPPGDTDRIMVLERDGTIWLRKDGVRLPTPFLDLTGITGGGHEYGVLGLAFHPQYASNHRFFVYYVDNDANAQLVEYQATDADHASPTPVDTLLSLTFPSDAIHYGGTIGFGRDGYLYIALGDARTGGSPSSPAQDSTSLFGKMLRLDVDHAKPYAIPPDNPYVNRTGWRTEIYDLGLRNPYRWSFDRQTGDLYIGDVGEDNWEEVDFRPYGQGGANFGWPITEGTRCFRPLAGCSTEGLVLPVVTYSHNDGCSVTGGVVYRGSEIPDLQGTYLYGDFCGGWVRRAEITGGRAVDAGPQLDLPLINGNVDDVVGICEDAQGEVYVVAASGWLYKIVEAPQVS
jgi:glucose/arabinose dehydrogenase